jgi:indolepyruvate ferredoxin oxidoreductase beta subunit
MSSHRTLLVGVGGQGVLTAARVLGTAAHAAGLPVVVGQLHGMSQRGGSIECTVKLGSDESTVIGPGEADVVVAFEPLEALRAVPLMRADTRVLTSLTAIVPFELARTGVAYPPIEAILDDLRAAAAEVVPIDGASIVGASGADRTLNAVLLGALAALGWLPIDAGRVLEAVIGRTATTFRDANRRAFELGRGAVRGREARV